ncbi:IclR family transcriptional regulator [Microbacterium sp. gxy059]|uniref:IclR family transcriptional regulator n=1 Tax=Microbacterium sp. gxy059 TaxID=2957199 RepID=UPI003D9878BD
MSQTIQRATELIEFIAEDPRTLAEAAQRFDVHRSTVFRQLQTLERAGFLVHRSDGRYAIGPRFIAIAQQALDRIDLRRVAHPHLAALQRRAGCTVHLAQLVDDGIVYVDKIEAASGVRMYSRIGRTVLPQATGVGKVILAQLDGDRRDRILRDVEWRAYTPTTLTSRAALDAELDRISQRGWGVDDSEFEEFTNCIAAPVASSSGAVVGAISLTSLRALHDLDALRAHLDDLLETAGRVSADLG